MRTTLDLPEELLEEARKGAGLKSKTDTVIAALQELVRRQRIELLKSMFGQFEIDVDLTKSRGRPEAQPRRKR